MGALALELRQQRVWMLVNTCQVQTMAVILQRPLMALILQRPPMVLILQRPPMALILQSSCCRGSISACRQETETR